MSAHGRPRQLAATVMVNGFGDLEGTAPGSSLTPCAWSVERARRISSAVSFALAVFPMAPDRSQLDSWTYKDASGGHVAASAASVRRWRDGLARCFRHAVAAGFTTLHVLGHFDPLHPVLLRPTTWRNLVDIAPRQKAAGFSYQDVMLQPVVDALGSATGAAPASSAAAVWFSVSGEMGYSNFFYPAEWIAVMADVRAQLKKQRWQSVRVAVAPNWQMHCGCVAAVDQAPGSFDPLAYNSSYAKEFAKVKNKAPPFARAYKALLDANDYLGLSGYGSGYPTSAAALSWRHMEVPLQTLAYELSFLGIDLKAYTASRPVIYVEQGLGGVLRYGVLPAPDLATVARYPFSGSWPSSYSKQIDPWQRPDFAEYRRAFYRATLDLLSRPREAQYGGVDAIMVWSVGSFDVFGVAWPDFADPQIVQLTARHNGVAG